MARANIHGVCWYYDIQGRKNFNEAKATAKKLEKKAWQSLRKIGGWTTEIQVLTYREKTTLRRRRKDSYHKAAQAEPLARK